MWDETVAAHGSSDALVSRRQGVRWTYDELHVEVERCARGLLAAGVTRGDRVGIWSPNNAEWVVVQFATAKVGAILVNVNPSYRSHELEYALRQSGCSVLIATRSFKDADYVAFETTLSTDADQIAIAPGYLQREWTEGHESPARLWK